MINRLSVGDYQILLDKCTLKEFDMVVDKPPADLKDGDTVYVDVRRWLFNPGDEVEVYIPPLFPKGLYVPVYSLFSNDGKNYVVKVKKNNRARYVEVKVKDKFNVLRRIEPVNNSELGDRCKVVICRDLCKIKDGDELLPYRTISIADDYNFKTLEEL